MKTRILTIIIGIAIVVGSAFLFLPSEQQNTCENMGGKWNVDHCLVTQETLDSNQLTCDPGPVLEDGTCMSNGIKLVIESTSRTLHEPEPERNPIPEGNYVDRNTYVYSVKDAESYLNYTLSTPHIPEGTELEKIKISSDKRKATLYYSNGLEIKHNPMGINFNNTHYKLNPEREEGKVFYDFGGTFAEGYEIDEPNRLHYSAITIHRDDRIYVRATMDVGLDELLKMIEPMDLNVPHVPYTPTPDYVMGAPEPEPIPEPKSEPAFPSDYPRISQNDMYCWTQWWYVQNTAIDEEKLVSSLRSTISMFGPDFDIPNREITVSHNGEETVISIGGLWTKDKVHHEKLTSVIKNHMDGSELIRDNIVMCA